MTIPLDVHAYIGAYPFRHVPHPEPDALVKVLKREGIASAWVGHLPSAFHRDPSHGNYELFGSLESYAKMLLPAPAIRPDWPIWERLLADVIDRGAAAIKAYPQLWGLSGDSPAMHRLVAATGEAGIPLLLTVRFEDLRQRHPVDVAGDLTAATIRHLAKVDERARLVVLAAGREMIEEVHWGLTPDEQQRVWWDISWIWGPPEDHLAHLFRTIGAQRFVYGTGWPLRLAQNPRASLALLTPELSHARMGDPRAT